MTNSWNGPQLGSPIRTDVPELQKKLIALLKQDPTSVANIPSGAKRLVNTSGVQWQVQQYNGSSWAAIGKLMHDVHKLDGYHAAITPAANTVAVRNADKKLEGDITGNAATATSAATLSQTLPVNKGGTGATTSEAARSNLGVPPTSHASANTTYGIGNAKQYGHLKLSDATDSLSGATGGIAATPAAVKAAKDAADAAQSAADIAQSSADAAMTKASTLATASAPGIVKPGTGMTVDAAGALNVRLNNTVTSTSTTQAATANAVKTAYNKAVNALPVGALHASFASSISGCLLCNGAAVSRTTYAALFAILDTKFGKGDGSTTFNLPDFRDKTLWGANNNLMSVLTAGLPNATGQVDILSQSGGWDSPYYGGALYAGSKYTSPYLLGGDSGNVNHSVLLDLSKCNTIYGNSTTVQPPAIAVNFFIKY